MESVASDIGAIEAAAPEPVDQTQADIRRFVGAVALVLSETVVAFEDTVARVTDMTVLRDGQTPDRSLVVALQEFDRLQQEFTNLSDVLRRISMAEKNADGAETPDEAAKLIATVSIAELRDRLIRYAAVLETDLQLAELPDDVVF